jgi:hypothetical protein
MNDERPARKGFIPEAMEIPVIGEYLTTILAIGPPVWLASRITGTSEDNPFLFFVLAAVSQPWILWLEKATGLRIVLPLIPIRIVYLFLPGWVVLGVYKLLGP